jgi:predicted nucleic acid-binding Zn finger protein
MRKTAGAFLAGRMARLSKLETAGEAILIGLGGGFLLALVEPWIGLFGVTVAYLATATAVFLAVRVLDHPKFKWNLNNLEKGANAEHLVGHAIEYAITARHCAAAHSVTEIAKVGDIDHIVATPTAVWVIETKHKRVPRKDFRDVLNRIAANTDAVRQWAPIGTPVRGCLVLAHHDGKSGRKAFTTGKEKITVYYTPRLLVLDLQTEAGMEQSLDRRVTKDIWRLGQAAQ